GNLVIWANEKGRIVMVSLPSQLFMAVREEYVSYANGLQSITTAAERRNYEIKYVAAPNAPFRTEEVMIERDGFRLAGTLLLPKSGPRPFPAVITITGSGQQTRDEPLPIPGLEDYKPFRQIAEKLAGEGIAVLRIDDRGVGSSTGAETLPTATTSSFAGDVRTEIAYLRNRPEIDPSQIALIGHSEGGSIAPMVAAVDPRISAIVLMAAPARRGSEVLAFQNKDVIEAEQGMEAKEKARRLAEIKDMLNILVSGGDTSKLPTEMRSPWIKEFVNYDPLPTIRQVKQPILILQGSLDHQVTPDQAPMLAEAARAAGNKDIELHLFPDLNHLFLKAKTGTFSEYQHLETSVIGDDVLNLILEWLKKRLFKF
ncbi:MAG: alpha/beta hydrolase family protein, partial [Pyrinomonadaceae bacterium]